MVDVHDRAGTARRLAGLLLLVAAPVVFALTAPPEDVGDRATASQIRAALADYESNNARTEGAPQQQVVNGWVAKDLLTVIAEQGAAPQAPEDDERVAAILALGVAGLGLSMLTTTSRTPPPTPSTGWPTP